MIVTFLVMVWVRASPDPHPYVGVQHIDKKKAYIIMIKKRQQLDFTKHEEQPLKHQILKVDTVEIRFVIRSSMVFNPLYGAVAVDR